jgi:hypothetical protein
MADRISRDDVDRIAESVSGLLPGTLSVIPGARNGYLALDLYDGTICRRTLDAGTKREMYTYLLGMRQAQLLALYGK